MTKSQQIIKKRNTSWETLRHFNVLMPQLWLLRHRELIHNTSTPSMTVITVATISKALHRTPFFSFYSPGKSQTPNLIEMTCLVTF